MYKPHLYIICGLPFSGKTILAKYLTKRFGFVRVNFDDINEERGLGDKRNDEISDEDWQKTCEIAYDDIDQALAMGKTVVNDGANHSKAERDKLREIAKKYNVPTYVVHVKIPAQVAKDRWLKNRETKAVRDMTDKEFAEVVDHFEEPAAEEGVILYEQALQPENWVNQIFLPTLEG